MLRYDGTASEVMMARTASEIINSMTVKPWYMEIPSPVWRGPLLIGACVGIMNFRRI